MLIAHLPAGALCAVFAEHRRARAARPTLGRAEIAAYLVGSVLPDADMAWFLWSGGHTHHHTYLTHRPAAWAVVCLLGLVLRAAGARGGPRLRRAGHVVTIVASMALLHLALDTFQGQIAWAWPLSDATRTWVHVPGVPGQHWVVSFMKHPFFWVELGITAAAVAAGWRVWAKRTGAARVPG